MKQRVIFVMTHDSIGLGEDGPTHQPVEHLAALRAIPDLLVFRPCDGIETAECWQLALESTQRPSLLSLTRQAVPTVRGAANENLSARGGYVLLEAEGKRQVTLIATGSEVALAVEARTQLQKEGLAAAVVSMPCTRLFDEQDEKYRLAVLGHVPRIVIEAAIEQGWERIIGAQGSFIGMKGFGASAPAEDLYKYFGITTEKIVEAAKKLP
jgi:transketolase